MERILSILVGTVLIVGGIYIGPAQIIQNLNTNKSKQKVPAKVITTSTNRNTKVSVSYEYGGKPFYNVPVEGTYPVAFPGDTVAIYVDPSIPDTPSAPANFYSTYIGVGMIGLGAFFMYITFSGSANRLLLKINQKQKS